MLQKIYSYLEKEYGQRGMWISDIARNLKISQQQANMLTYAAGYRRGKKIVPISFEEFAENASVRYVVKQISDNSL